MNRNAETSHHWSQSLQHIDACAPSVAYAKQFDSLQNAWDAYNRGDWMLWLLGKTSQSEPWSEERKPLVRIVVECAKLALKHTQDQRVATCITATENWLEGKGTREDVKSAADADADADADAAYAAYAAADSAADARIAIRKQCADLVRVYVPTAPTLEN